MLSGSKSDRSMMETGFGDNVTEAVFVHSLSAKRCQQVTVLLCVLDTFVFLQTRIARINSVAIRYDGTKMLGTWKAKRKQFMRHGPAFSKTPGRMESWRVR